METLAYSFLLVACGWLGCVLWYHNQIWPKEKPKEVDPLIAIRDDIQKATARVSLIERARMETPKSTAVDDLAKLVQEHHKEFEENTLKVRKYMQGVIESSHQASLHFRETLTNEMREFQSKIETRSWDDMKVAHAKQLKTDNEVAEIKKQVAALTPIHLTWVKDVADKKLKRVTQPAPEVSQ